MSAHSMIYPSIKPSAEALGSIKSICMDNSQQEKFDFPSLMDVDSTGPLPMSILNDTLSLHESFGSGKLPSVETVLPEEVSFNKPSSRMVSTNFSHTSIENEPQSTDNILVTSIPNRGSSNIKNLHVSNEISESEVLQSSSLGSLASAHTSNSSNSSSVVGSSSRMNKILNKLHPAAIRRSSSSPVDGKPLALSRDDSSNDSLINTSLSTEFHEKDEQNIAEGKEEARTALLESSDGFGEVCAGMNSSMQCSSSERRKRKRPKKILSNVSSLDVKEDKESDNSQPENLENNSLLEGQSDNVLWENEADTDYSKDLLDYRLYNGDSPTDSTKQTVPIKNIGQIKPNSASLITPRFPLNEKNKKRKSYESSINDTLSPLSTATTSAVKTSASSMLYYPNMGSSINLNMQPNLKSDILQTIPKRSPGRPRIHPPKDKSLKRPPGRPRIHPPKDPTLKRPRGRPKQDGSVPRSIAPRLTPKIDNSNFTSSIVSANGSSPKSLSQTISSSTSQISASLSSELPFIDNLTHLERQLISKNSEIDRLRKLLRKYGAPENEILGFTNGIEGNTKPAFKENTELNKSIGNFINKSLGPEILTSSVESVVNDPAVISIVAPATVTKPKLLHQNNQTKMMNRLNQQQQQQQQQQQLQAQQPLQEASQNQQQKSLPQQQHQSQETLLESQNLKLAEPAKENNSNNMKAEAAELPEELETTENVKLENYTKETENEDEVKTQQRFVFLNSDGSIKL